MYTKLIHRAVDYASTSQSRSILSWVFSKAFSHTSCSDRGKSLIVTMIRLQASDTIQAGSCQHRIGPMSCLTLENGNLAISCVVTIQSDLLYEAIELITDAWTSRGDCCHGINYGQTTGLWRLSRWDLIVVHPGTQADIRLLCSMLSPIAPDTELKISNTPSSA